MIVWANAHQSVIAMKSAAQSASDKNDRIELFEVPEFGEVEADRRRLDETVVFDTLDQPSNSAFNRFLRSRDFATAEQGVYRQRRLFNARGRLRSAAPASVVALRPDKPLKAAQGGFGFEKI